jgi:hypothetical protein
MMNDLVGFINELVDDQIEMRSCVPLTPELKEFYRKLTGRDMEADSSEDNQIGDEDDEETMERFVMPRKRFTRKVVSQLIRDNPPVSYH